MSDQDSMAASVALARAGELDAKVRSSSKWYVRYLLVYAVGSFVMTLAVGLLHSRAAIVFTTVGWSLVVAGMSVYAAVQKVSRRGFGRRHVSIIAVWGALYVGVLAVGNNNFPGQLGWWLPGALLVAAPALLGAYLESRR